MLAQVMYSGQPKDHAGGSLEAMQANVRGIKEHPAILGYYMCATAARQRACCCSLLSASCQFDGVHFISR